MQRLPILKSFFKSSVDPYKEFNKLQTEIDTLFDEMFGNWNAPTFTVVEGTYPKINVLSKKDKFEIIAATPGLSREELNVSLKDDILTIKGESKQDDMKNDDKFLCRELKKSNFFRSFRLDKKTMNTENISSSYENGELRVSVPKKEKDKEKENSVNINIT